MKACYLTLFISLISFFGNSQNSNEIVASIGNADLSVMYRGVENRISVAAYGVPLSAKVTCEGCKEFEKTSVPSLYVAQVSSDVSKTTVTISYNGKSASQVFLVRPTPKPVVYLAGTDPTSIKIRKNSFGRGYLTVALLGSPLIIDATIISGNLTATVNGVVKTYKLKGNKIPKKALDLIKMLPAETHVTINVVIRTKGSDMKLEEKNYVLK